MLNKKKDTTENSIEESMSESISDLNDSGSKPMNETLTDLSLDESDRQDLSLEGVDNIYATNHLFCKRFKKQEINFFSYYCR